MWRTLGEDPNPDTDGVQYVPITPNSGRSGAWNRLVRLIWSHLLFFAAAVGVSLALIYFEATTQRFFRLDPPRQVGDPCLTLIRATKGPNLGMVWANFGSCRDAVRDADREMVVVDLRHGLLLHYATEPVLAGALSLPFARVLRNQDHASRAFGKGGTHTYDMGLVGDAARFSWVDLVLAGGGRVHYLPSSKPGWFDSDVAGYFNNTNLQWTGHDWRLQRDDGIQLVFPESQGATRLEQAALVRMQTANGNALVVVDRDLAGNVLRVNAGGRQLDFERDTMNRVTAISEADTDLYLHYEYDSDGCLAQRTGPGDKFRYEHDSRNGGCSLRRVTQDGVTRFEVDYDADDRVVQLTDAAGGVYVVSYETDRRGRIVRTEVTDPEGTLRRIVLDDTGYWISRWGSYRRR